MMNVRKRSLNIAVDMTAFAMFVLLTSTGVLLRYVLPPGQGRFTSIWGLDRHDWGQIHFYMSMLFLLCLTVHLISHGRWIVLAIKGRSGYGSPYRFALGAFALLALLATASAPFFAEVDRSAPGDRNMKHRPLDSQDP